MAMIKNKIFWIAVILILFVLFTSIFVIQQYEIAVVTQFGKPIRIIVEPGLKIKLPYPFQKVYKYDKRINTFSPPSAEFLTSDKKNFIIDTFICWRITDPVKFLQTVITKENAEARLTDIIWANIGAAFGKTPLDAILSTNPATIKTNQLEEEIRINLNDPAQKQIGAEILIFRIKRINYPEQNKRSVFERMVAERARIATQFRSEGEEESMKIRSSAEKEKASILADAKRQAEIIRGKADAEATRIYANSFSKYPEFYKFFRTLQAYKKIINKNSIIIIPSDSILLKYLNNPDAK
jgi:membrane protease subunit HflC